MQPTAVLLWFYKAPDVVHERIAQIRRRNPRILLFGLYGGPPAELARFSSSLSQFNDLWVHPPVSSDWAWRNGDLMLVRWYEERGIHLTWQSLFIHQWDLLLEEPAQTFSIHAPDELVLPGVRPLAEVAESWVWVQPWSTHFHHFEAFCRSAHVRGAEILACVFVFAVLSRRFFEDYARVAPSVPGMFEYRLPTLARALGYRLRSGAVHPDWDDRGDPLLNGRQRQVTSEQIRARRAAGGTRMWHPVPEPEEHRVSPSPGSLNARGPCHTVGIVQVAPARPEFTPGGSQAVAHTLARGLASAGFAVHVFYGTRDEHDIQWVDQGIRYTAAFQLTPKILETGVPPVELFPNAASLLRRCSVVFMLDRVFPLHSRARAILVLGTLDYEFAVSAVLSDRWHEMIVPSQYMKREVALLLAQHSKSARLAGVHVIPNPVDIDARAVSRTQRTSGSRVARLLFPHRADRGKGMRAALELVVRLSRMREVVLAVTADTSPTADPAFYKTLLAEGRALGIAERIEMLPWQDRLALPALYASADITLCLGTLREGFGLVCLESIVCGTPVLARDTGEQTHLLPRDCGCFTIPADVAQWPRLAAEILDSPLLNAELAKGAHFIRQHYSASAFITRVRLLLQA